MLFVANWIFSFFRDSRSPNFLETLHPNFFRAPPIFLETLFIFLVNQVQSVSNITNVKKYKIDAFCRKLDFSFFE
jgi:hypothetical protein